jgi:hypothetical protein
MTNTGGGQGQEFTTIESAFPGTAAPAELSVGIVSLVELCNLAMPDPNTLYQRIREAKFTDAAPEQATEFGRALALEDRVFSFPVRNLRHKLFAKDRHNEAVVLLVTEGESSEGPVVFCSSFFRGAMEADVVKAVAHVSKKQPLTGANVDFADGTHRRRIFWDMQNASGVRGLMVTGPHNVEALDLYRAITAFNVAGRKQ